MRTMFLLVAMIFVVMTLSVSSTAMASDTTQEEICSDNVDNDNDGATDCEDRGDCARTQFCKGYHAGRQQISVVTPTTSSTIVEDSNNNCEQNPTSRCLAIHGAGTLVPSKALDVLGIQSQRGGPVQDFSGRLHVLPNGEVKVETTMRMPRTMQALSPLPTLDPAVVAQPIVESHFEWPAWASVPSAILVGGLVAGATYVAGGTDADCIVGGSIAGGVALGTSLVFTALTGD